MATTPKPPGPIKALFDAITQYPFIARLQSYDRNKLLVCLVSVAFVSYSTFHANRVIPDDMKGYETYFPHLFIGYAIYASLNVFLFTAFYTKRRNFKLRTLGLFGLTLTSLLFNLYYFLRSEYFWISQALVALAFTLLIPSMCLYFIEWNTFSTRIGTYLKSRWFRFMIVFCMPLAAIWTLPQDWCFKTLFHITFVILLRETCLTKRATKFTFYSRRALKTAKGMRELVTDELEIPEHSNIVVDSIVFLIPAAFFVERKARIAPCPRVFFIQPAPVVQLREPSIASFDSIRGQVTAAQRARFPFAMQC